MRHFRASDRTTCKHGHPFPECLTYDRRGYTRCVECDRIKSRRYSQTMRAPDPTAIERAIQGDPPDRLTPRERAAAVLALTERNVAAWRIAEQLGCSQRTVHRVRSRYAAAA